MDKGVTELHQALISCPMAQLGQLGTLTIYPQHLHCVSVNVLGVRQQFVPRVILIKFN